MKKSIFLFFAAILCAMSANAAQVTPNGKYFYFKTSSTWDVDNPRYAVYFAWRNGGAEDKTWVSCQTVPGTTDILYVTAPGEFWDIYFCRMNGSTTDNKDANVWNKTDKLQYDGSKNYWTKSTGWNGTTTYSTYVPAISSVTLLDNGTNIISGTGTQADPYLVYVETTIKVKGAGTKVLEDPDAKLNYKFKQGTTSKQEGTSATYQFTASATADTEYTINLDGYTKVNTTKSTVTKSATALYYKTVERAEETNTVTISYKCGDKDVQTGITEVVGVSTTSSFTAPTNITGYKFTNWTIGAGIDLKAGTASDATITVVTKSAASDYTLVANYEEVMETVYFINTNKWARVNIHKWDGKAAASSWPGEQLTASGEKIGEYGVYSYTAKQGDYAKIIFNSKTSGTDGGNDQTADLDWTAGKYYIHNYNGNKGWYTKAEAEELLVAPIVYEKVYFVNNKKWSLVQIHAWKDAANNGWPGQALTATGEQVAGFDVYSFEAAKGTYTNLLFNNKEGDAGVQSNNFVWTADKYYYMDAAADYAGGTAAEVEAALAAPVVEETVYFVNNKNWTKVQVHAWKDAANNGWPGQALTATGEKVAGFDVYSFTAAQGTYTNLLFNNKEGDAGVQSNNFVWTADKYYYMGAAENYAGGTKEEVAVLVTPDPLATEVYLAGDMTNKDNWDVNKKEFRKATNDATTASVTVTLAAQTYKFKLVIDGAWKGNTGTMQRGGDAVHEGGWSFDKDGYDDNCQIVADIAGDYTFTWNLTDKKLTVAYPPLPKHQVTATVNPAESGTVTGTGEYEQGTVATLIATPAAGYTFTNWTVAGTEKSAEATYKFTVTETVELVANFVPEVTHEVTVSYLCDGNPIPDQATTTLAVGVTTPSTISAPSITNYKFDSWTLGTGVQSEDASKNPIKVTSKSTGEYTLAANYTKIELTYNVQVPAGTEKCFIRGAFDGWDKFHEMTKVDDTHYTITIEGATTEHKYKYACGDSWDYVEKDKDGNDIEDRTYSANDVVIKWGKPIVVTYQLKGVGGWEQPGIELVQNPGNDKEYMLTCQAISATDAIKIVRLENGEIKDYYGNGTVKDGVSVAVEYDDKANIKLPAGTYNFYFDTNEPEKKLWIEAATDCEPTPDYTRTVTAGNYGTICLPFGGEITGAVLYECVGRETGKVYLGSVNTLTAGVPYIFQATATELAVYSDGTTATSAGNSNGLHGTFDNETVVAMGHYILLSNTLRPSNGEAKVNANRAYLVMSEVPAGAPQQMPGRRYIGMSVQGENETTGVENLFTTDTPVKVIENGQLIIIRDGVKYNVHGQKL